MKRLFFIPLMLISSIFQQTHGMAARKIEYLKYEISSRQNNPNYLLSHQDTPYLFNELSEKIVELYTSLPQQHIPQIIIDNHDNGIQVNLITHELFLSSKLLLFMYNNATRNPTTYIIILIGLTYMYETFLHDDDQLERFHYKKIFFSSMTFDIFLWLSSAIDRTTFFLIPGMFFALMDQSYRFFKNYNRIKIAYDYTEYLEASHPVDINILKNLLDCVDQLYENKINFIDNSFFSMINCIKNWYNDHQ